MRTIRFRTDNHYIFSHFLFSDPIESVQNDVISSSMDVSAMSQAIDRRSKASCSDKPNKTKRLASSQIVDYKKYLNLDIELQRTKKKLNDEKTLSAKRYKLLQEENNKLKKENSDLKSQIPSKEGNVMN